jgi:hypothetical protein
MAGLDWRQCAAEVRWGGFGLRTSKSFTAPAPWALAVADQPRDHIVIAGQPRKGGHRHRDAVDAIQSQREGQRGYLGDLAIGDVAP